MLLDLVCFIPNVCLPLLAVWGLSALIYRVYFHPLADIPGPLLGRMFHFYSFWHNMRGSRFYLHIQDLHIKYGPVVRITPQEVHLSDPEHIDTIYSFASSASSYGKDSSFYSSFGTSHATFTTCDPAQHRAKRATLNPFFSARRVAELEPRIQAKVTQILTRTNVSLTTTGAVELHGLFRALALDVVTDYAFDQSYGFLARRDLGRDFFAMIASLGPGVWVFNQFPFLRGVATALPLWIAWGLSTSLARMIVHRRECRQQILRVKEKVDGEEGSGRSTTIFHHLLRADTSKNPAPVPSLLELEDEAYVLLAAAADTTANALTVAVYHTVRNARVYGRLVEELEEAFPGDSEGTLSYQALKALPYLTGVIKEALRLSSGVPGRLPRVVPRGGATFGGYRVPEGTVVSMSPWTVNRNENIFPDPEEFSPDRWLDPEESRLRDRYLFSFGKGSTQCIGMPLAYSELYIVLGRFFRAFRQLETRHKSKDELLYNDYFSGFFAEENEEFVFWSARRG
ncbi:cytochrome P450 [Aspergillus homomorphus CBS 101889]|uniref:Cytochrome P450 n=1 Tax=Aspergillus homomorphus (strain CBS 101889) TaxID=1450537 RepID=A0A395I1D6_ASPHC|nr:cytochrome P450 [Aspergillus homomorphus CBS 101889]RAL13545.1 cytochrome P450 [Aspergillus homomorphus CBS 101889]